MPCAYCGTPLAPDADPRAIYCKQACKFAAYRARKREAEAQMVSSLFLIEAISAAASLLPED